MYKFQISNFKFKLPILIAAFLLAVLPAGAVLKERDLNQTISVLRAELENAFREQKEQLQALDLVLTIATS